MIFIKYNYESYIAIVKTIFVQMICIKNIYLKL